MKIAFYLAHPAHFHLFKHVVFALADRGNKILVLYNKKDVLHELVKNLVRKNIKVKKVHTIKTVQKSNELKIQFVQKVFGAFWNLLLFKPKIVIGTPVLISLIGRVLRYKSIIVNEDDFDIIKKTADLGYPHASHIVCPEVCRTGNFKDKCIQYSGYHELAYLHPNHFKPDNLTVKKYGIDTEKNYAIMRFAKLSAHHDRGIKGINLDIAVRLIELLKPHMDVFITSERQIEQEFESYRIAIDPIDMHHVMAFSSLYIGDSQTMAAEAGVLGIPFIRFNDFVGRISYLDELENKYNLGYGVLPENPEMLFRTVKNLLNMLNRKKVFRSRRKKMLDEKINTASFLVWFIENYPKSVTIMKETPEFQFNFK